MTPASRHRRSTAEAVDPRQPQVEHGGIVGLGLAEELGAQRRRRRCPPRSRRGAAPRRAGPAAPSRLPPPARACRLGYSAAAAEPDLNAGVSRGSVASVDDGGRAGGASRTGGIRERTTKDAVRGGDRDRRGGAAGVRGDGPVARLARAGGARAVERSIARRAEFQLCLAAAPSAALRAGDRRVVLGRVDVTQRARIVDRRRRARGRDRRRSPPWRRPRAARRAAAPNVARSKITGCPWRSPSAGRTIGARDRRQAASRAATVEARTSGTSTRVTATASSAGSSTASRPASSDESWPEVQSAFCTSSTPAPRRPPRARPRDGRRPRPPRARCRLPATTVRRRRRRSARRRRVAGRPWGVPCATTGRRRGRCRAPSWGVPIVPDAGISGRRTLDLAWSAAYTARTFRVHAMARRGDSPVRSPTSGWGRGDAWSREYR